jgi:hypothetical protein
MQKFYSGRVQLYHKPLVLKQKLTMNTFMDENLTMGTVSVKQYCDWDVCSVYSGYAGRKIFQDWNKIWRSVINHYYTLRRLLTISLRITEFLEFVQHLVFWTEHNISKTGSVSVFRWKYEKPFIHLDLLERPQSLDHHDCPVIQINSPGVQ